MVLAPPLGYLGWSVNLDTTAREGCLTAAGSPCPSPRSQAVANLVDALPALAAALCLALLLALALRRAATTWRSAKVAFAASVIGAGVTTLVTQILG